MAFEDCDQTVKITYKNKQSDIELYAIKALTSAWQMLAIGPT
jgi:hypothetical protein